MGRHESDKTATTSAGYVGKHRAENWKGGPRGGKSPMGRPDNPAGEAGHDPHGEPNR